MLWSYFWSDVVIVILIFLCVYFSVNQTNNYIETNFLHKRKEVDEIVSKIDEIKEKPSGPEFE